MAWKFERAFPSDKLNKIRNWEAKGLAYWEARVVSCANRVKTAESSKAIRLALSDKEVASVAVAKLKGEWWPR